MDVSQKYKIIYDMKTKLIKDYQNIEDDYINKVINYFINNKININFNSIKKEKTILSGVYLMYCKIDNKTIFTYVGESIDLFKRFKQHIQSLNTKKRNYRIMKSLGANEENINFIILSLEKNQNIRLFLETYYIYVLRSKRLNLNSKLVSKRAKCSNNHGNLASRLNNLNNSKLRIGVSLKCKNKLCKEIINLYDNKELLYNRI
ncbi:hypothetical protein SLITO_v1c10270 [Spiroplasma litorale]|uniref:GIY-YIG domain-containing protein n=1 Tax=Spiroplasma litorale TaxID=216942 RepID=A0A0K1W379_9MOLU|nr:GIY-YIG nuclease family protein [Spiroplasma litorale]AKX34638.1 hypothetical protein SLITO_v1c10270 [Spiroplasma litorale]